MICITPFAKWLPSHSSLRCPGGPTSFHLHQANTSLQNLGTDSCCTQTIVLYYTECSMRSAKLHATLHPTTWRGLVWRDSHIFMVSYVSMALLLASACAVRCLYCCLCRSLTWLEAAASAAVAIQFYRDECEFVSWPGYKCGAVQ